MTTKEEIIAAMAAGRLRLQLHGPHNNVPIFMIQSESGDSWKYVGTDDAKLIGLPIAIGTTNPNEPDWTASSSATANPLDTRYFSNKD